MPYEGDSPAEAWEFWFDEPPSPEIRQHLEERTKAHAPAVIIEAIEITAHKLIEGETGRIQYVNGILRRRALEQSNPERAEIERQLDSLQKYWEREAITTWPLNRRQALAWMRYLSPEAIKVAIHIASGWYEFKELIDQAIQKTALYQEEREAAAAAAAAEQAAQEERKRMTVIRGGRHRKARGAAS